MKCIYCGEEVGQRGEGDHVVPASLGRMLPELTLDCVCEVCDNENGRNFETAFARMGFVGWFRRVHQIQSKHSKGNPLYNPLTNRKSGYQAGGFDVYRELPDGQRARPYALPSGEIYASLTAEVIDGERTEREIHIPPYLDAEGIADFLVKLVTDVKPKRVKYHVPEEIAAEIAAHVLKSGVTIKGQTTDPKRREFTKYNVHTVLDERYQRAVLNITLKAMIYAGYNPSLLRPALDFARYEKWAEPSVSRWDEDRMDVNFTDDLPLSAYWHYFMWRVYHDCLQIEVSLVNRMEKRGCISQFRFPLGEDRSIIIPNGHLLVVHRADGGWLHLVKGGSVLKSGCPDYTKTIS